MHNRCQNISCNFFSCSKSNYALYYYRGQKRNGADQIHAVVIPCLYNQPLAQKESSQRAKPHKTFIDSYIERMSAGSVCIVNSAKKCKAGVNPEQCEADEIYRKNWPFPDKKENDYACSMKNPYRDFIVKYMTEIHHAESK